MKAIIVCCVVMMVCLQATVAQVNQQRPNDQNAGQPQYKDLATGKSIRLQYNQKDSTMYDLDSRQPVDFFINSTGDTVSSRGFYVVNNYLVRGNDQRYALDTSKVQMRGAKMWGVENDRELQMDKNWQQYQRSPGAQQKQP
ncbi:MAG: hypothetical protein ACTHLE_08030 [Agriterribacter sp.]